MSDKNGQYKCPSCGSTEISFDENKGKLKCDFCNCLIQPEKVRKNKKRKHKRKEKDDVQGKVISEGASDIVEDKDIITLRCSSCGADVIINTCEELQARCHWCRNTLSINEKVPNGAVPDAILPFSVKKSQAYESMTEFIKTRKKYANKKFLRDFNEEGIIGVYLPYMLVDVNASVSMQGIGEKTGKKHEIVSFFLSGKDVPDFYSVDVYDICRDFKLEIKDLTLESNDDRADVASDRTNNIVNSILPYDIDNLVEWNANYLKGYNSEKRDLNVGNLEYVVNEQSKDIMRLSMKKSIEKYDRGVEWDREEMKVDAQKWETAYLPVWLYSYVEKGFYEDKIRYIAVNGRTRETAGSIPMNKPKYIFGFLIPHIITWLIFGIIGILACQEIEDNISTLIMLSVTILFFQCCLCFGKDSTLERYLNRYVRHDYEKQTKYTVSDLKKEDTFLEKKYLQKDGKMYGYNHDEIEGNKFGRVEEEEE